LLISNQTFEHTLPELFDVFTHQSFRCLTITGQNCFNDLPVFPGTLNNTRGAGLLVNDRLMDSISGLQD
jgi:hypothetical protein